MCLLRIVVLRDEFDFFFFKQKTAYEMRISDWSSDVCSSDLPVQELPDRLAAAQEHPREVDVDHLAPLLQGHVAERGAALDAGVADQDVDRPEAQIGRASCRERVCQSV